MIKTSIDKALKKTESKAARQTAALLTSDVLSIGLGIGVSVINTRLLGPKDFGDFKYLMTLFSFVMVFFGFGIASTGSRLIALKGLEYKKKNIIGGILTIFMANVLIFSTVLYIVSYIQEEIYGNGLGRVIRILIPILLFFPFQTFMEKILEGDNRIYTLSVFRTTPKVLYILTLYVVSLVIAISATQAVIIHMLAIAALLPFIIRQLAPSFQNIRESVAFVLKENKVHGRQVYWGALVSNGSQSISTFTISYFLDNISVGFFVLANTIARPLMMIPQTIGTTLYKKFANSDRIPTNILLLTLGVTLSIYCVFIVAIKYIVLFVYSEEFLPVLPIVYLVSISFIVQGFCAFINRFLNSHGRGIELRNASFVRGGINIIGFIVLVKYFGINGACITLITSNIVYLLSLIVGYRRYVRSKS